ncbi:hypothetical protein HHL19_35795 [Streptomyces sp. R302]|uniref:hypothetical protein n=1 Tax=unclassified Streptomyces TaxID=2593676 RepID=UPI00145E8991|nr:MULTISPECIES: hypothetical protein [unclassified Streptomyces]NML55096.1 hypothetical protein [Streptomyces sp. R301]NML83874.1 hypothetical protein [Streptomyces sp. R302]
MARKMSATERAARDVVNKYVRDGLMERGQANCAIRDGLHIAETTVRREYVENGWGSALYYGQKVAAAREEFAAAKSGSVSQRMKGARLLAAEIFAAVFAVVEAEEGPREGAEQLTPGQAEEVMATVRDTAREMREESATPRAGLTAAA